MKVEVDSSGKPISVSKRVRNDAHRLIEEFMIMANEEVSRFFSEKKIPFLYRIHEKPSEDSAIELAKILAEYSISIDISKITPLLLSQIINSLK
jgi:ribonuclease R